MRTYALLLSTAKHDDVEPRDPSLELASPVVQSALRDDDEMRAMDAAVELEVAEEGDRLESLAESLDAQVVSDNVVWNDERQERTISSARMPLIPL